MSSINDIFQVDYLQEKREIRINLPEEVWDSIDTITLTRLFQEELVVEKKESADAIDFMNEEGGKKKLADGEWKHYCPECQEG